MDAKLKAKDADRGRRPWVAAKLLKLEDATGSGGFRGTCAAHVCEANSREKAKNVREPEMDDEME